MDVISGVNAQMRIPDMPAAIGPMSALGRSQPLRAPWRHPMPADVVMDRGFIIVRADLPGIPGENVEVSVTSKYVEIIGWPPEAAPSSGYFMSERQHEVVRRTLRLPDDVVAHRSVARLSGGVLEVRIPRLPLSSGWVGTDREA